jgi:dTMP kinase
MGRRLSMNYIYQLNEMATGGIEPDLVLWLDISVEKASQRLRESKRHADRIETTGDIFMTSVRHGFATLFDKNAHWRRVNGDSDPDDIAATCLRHITYSLA